MFARFAAVLLAAAVAFGALALNGRADAADDGDVLRAVIAQVNAVRASQGLAPVAADSRLTAAAAAHNARLAAQGRLSHDGFPARMQALGASYGFVAENLAAGQPTAASVVAAWMQSAPHRANLLQPSISVVGVARSEGPKVFWTLILAQRA
jgi:uncharacterized protein YkwD